MPMRVFTSKRRNVSRERDAASVGDLRLSAKPITGAGVVEPLPGLLYCNGGAAARATYKRLLDLISFVQSITTTAASNAATVVDSSRMFVGMAVEHPNIPAATTVASIVDATHITLSANATATGAANGTFFPFGNGDGATTFNLPDFRGRFLAGVTDGSAAAIKIAGLLLGGVLGSESLALAKANVPPHAHGVGTLNIVAGGSHAHGASALNPGLQNTAASNDFAWWRGNGTPQAGTSNPKVPDGGAITASTHAHPPDAGTNVGNGSADGLAGTGHQNVHPHQAFGGVLVAY